MLGGFFFIFFNYVMSFTGIKVSIFILCAFCVGRREREQRIVDSGSICSGRKNAGIIPAGRQLPVCLQLCFENLQLTAPHHKYFTATPDNIKVQADSVVTIESGSLTPLFIPLLVPLSLLFLLWH